MPRRTSKSTIQGKGAKTAEGKQGSGLYIPEHMPKVGDIALVIGPSRLFDIAPTETVYVRVTHIDGGNIWFDMCGMRRLLHSADIERLIAPAEGVPFTCVVVGDEASARLRKPA